jgi:hypothetical protein
MSAVSGAAFPIPTLASVRTLLEATCFPDQGGDGGTALATGGSNIASAWSFWHQQAASQSGDVDRWPMYRYSGRIAAVVVALIACVVLALGRRKAEHNLLGGLLAVMAAALLASESGAVARLALLIPVVLPILAQPPGASATSDQEGEDLPRPIRLGPVPRISVEQ